MTSNAQGTSWTWATWRGALTVVAVASFLGLVASLLAVSLPGLDRHSAEKLPAYWVHIGGGTVALSLAPFQFVAPLRRRFRRYHRVAGYAFAGGSAAAFVGVHPTTHSDWIAWVIPLVAVEVYYGLQWDRLLARRA